MCKIILGLSKYVAIIVAFSHATKHALTHVIKLVEHLKVGFFFKIG
jgi:hypothetical protein